ncbi:MAG: ABC transporter permease [Bacillota bacterium]
MNIKDTLKLALEGLLANKLRSLLTLLGIVIGVGAIILMISLGGTTEQVVEGEFAHMARSQIWIYPDPDLSEGQQGELIAEDRKFIVNNVEGVTEGFLYYSGDWQQVYYEDNSSSNFVYGIEEGAEVSNNLELRAGRYITNHDIVSQNEVAVIGEFAVRNLSDVDKTTEFLGKEIEVNDDEFTVIGIIDERSPGGMIGPMDVLVPYQTIKSSWEFVDNPNYLTLNFDAENFEDNQIMSQIEYLLERRHGVTGEGESRFMVDSLEQAIEVTQDVISVFNYVLGAIAAISLLVGGIGVMNIMLVSVKERTEEIGLRMALGATKGQIRSQFILETVFLSLTGGVIGIIVGVSFSYLVDFIIMQFLDWWEIVIPFWIIGVSFAVTAFIGIIFGFYPAYKASRFDPIDAIRFK